MSSPSPWDIASTVSTVLATVIALAVAVIALVLRRRDQQAALRAARDDHDVELLRQVSDVLAGRLNADPGTQPGRELRLPALIATLPPEYTGMLRWSEPGYDKSGAHFARYVEPWKSHPLWDAPGNVPNLEVLLADIAMTIRRIRTGQ